MSLNTRISWADHSLSVHYGCSKISAGCVNCYATQPVHRLSHNPNIAYLSSDPDQAVTVDARTWSGRVVFNPAALEVPRRTRRAARWFVSSLSDTFHDAVADDEIAQIYATAADCALNRDGHGPHHQFLVLTKRPERAAELLNKPSFVDAVDAHRQHRPHAGPAPWPLPNLWLGTTIEHNHTTQRADALRAAPAAVRWISAEPLLGPLDCLDLDGIDWVVAGGESDRTQGRTARTCDLAWLRRLRDRCHTAGVAFHLKQVGSVQARAMHMTSPAGAALGELPPDLRIRQWPTTSRCSSPAPLAAGAGLGGGRS